MNKLILGSSSKLTLTTSHSNSNPKDAFKTDSPRTFSSAKRFGGDTSSHGKSNPFNTLTPGGSNTIASPTVGGSTAFGLGSGAFASFGSSSKAPKTPGGAIETQPVQEKATSKPAEKVQSKTSASSLNAKTTSTTDHPLKCSWVVWYRPPTSKNADYEKSITALASFSTVESFWAVYTHLKRPSTLPSVSDYHIFKKGVRPVWEDGENKKGGKFVVRLKKGVADRYWEDLLLAIVGDQFGEAGEEVTGAVLSVRSGEDVLSVWTKLDGGRNIRIRETIRRLLSFPLDTQLVFKSHDASIAQRTALDQARQEKVSGTASSGLKRRDTLAEDSAPATPRS
ncbi:MAG: hypothetical protein LQ340_000320 [Diploschistes diacapsis]|nr:MAG: hypothetical protein LQ340_000320 [Diploschistes diacapsis]